VSQLSLFFRRPHSAAAVRPRWLAGRSRADCRRLRRVQVCRSCSPTSGVPRRCCASGRVRDVTAEVLGGADVPAAVTPCPTVPCRRSPADDPCPTASRPDAPPGPRPVAGRTVAIRKQAIASARRRFLRSQRTSCSPISRRTDTRRGQGRSGRLTLTPGFLRLLDDRRRAACGSRLSCWARPHAPDTYEPLAAVCAAAGCRIACWAFVVAGPLCVSSGTGRCARLAEMIGTRRRAPRGAFPALSH